MEFENSWRSGVRSFTFTSVGASCKSIYSSRRISVSIFRLSLLTSTLLKEGPEGGSYSHFPAHILTNSHCPTAQIPSSLCRSCSNLNPIPIFYCFFVDESQSQCMKSHFPSQKMDKSQFPFYPFRTPLKDSLINAGK